jgi:hypothetical protein
VSFSEFMNSYLYLKKYCMVYVKVRGKAVPVTGRRGPYGCETSRRPYFLDNRLTDSGEVVSFTHRPPFTPQENSWYAFLLETESTPGP